MVHLDYLQLKAFRSFVDLVTFNFPRNGLILINGKNLQTNDASGTGKSSVFLGVAYVLNILPDGVVASSLQSFLTKDKMQAIVGLESPGYGKIIVGRGKETFIEYQGKRYEGATLVNQHLETVFELTKEMLYTMAYRPQRSNGLFLTKTDTEKKEFLTALLGLDKIESAVDTANTLVKSLTTDLVSIDAQIKSKEDVLAQIKYEDVTLLEEENKAISTELLDFQAEKERLDGQLIIDTKQYQEDVKAIEEKYADLKKKAKDFIFTLKGSDATRQLNIDINNLTYREQVNLTVSMITRIEGYHAIILTKGMEIVKLKADSCPTCDRQWDNADIKLKEIQDEIVWMERECGKLDELKEHKKKLEGLIVTFIPDSRIETLQATIEEFDAKCKAETPIDTRVSTMTAIGQNNSKIHELSQKIAVNNITVSRQNQFQKLHTTVTKDLESLKAQKSTKEATLQLESDFVKVLGKEGFLGSIFDEVLAEIVQAINNKLSSVANMSTVTFDFKTENLNTKGVVKKSIVPMVKILGHENKITALSGGMLSSLELITDLAVKEVIERRTGKEIGFYFTDEAFNGQGQPTKEACLEILKTGSANKAFYIIDHHSEFKELFTQVIDIEMENGVSKLK